MTRPYAALAIALTLFAAPAMAQSNTDAANSATSKAAATQQHTEAAKQHKKAYKHKKKAAEEAGLKAPEKMPTAK